MSTDDKLLLVGKVLKVLLVILVFLILVIFELAKDSEIILNDIKTWLDSVSFNWKESNDYVLWCKEYDY